jgi:hypothetical protein
MKSTIEAIIIIRLPIPEEATLTDMRVWIRDALANTPRPFRLRNTDIGDLLVTSTRRRPFPVQRGGIKK